MRDKLVFIGKFLLFSTLLFLIWIFLGIYYLLFLAYIATPILHLMGYAVELIVHTDIIFLYHGAELGITNAQLTNYNIIPFVALILATPIPLRKMAHHVIIGIPILFSFHLLNLIAHFPLFFNGNTVASFIISFSAVTRMLLPFLLWFALCYEYVLSSFRSKKKKYRCPLCGKETTGILMHINDVHKNIKGMQQKEIEQFKRKYPELIQ